MPFLPRPAAWTALPADVLDQYADEIERVAAGTFADNTNTSKPRFLVARTSDLTNIPSFTDTVVTWQTAVSDPRSMWAIGTPTIITIKDAGDWLIFSQERWPIPSSAGSYAGKIMKNGTNPTTAGVSQASGKLPSQGEGEGTTVGIVAQCRLAVNDLLRLNAWHSTSALNSLVTDFGGTYFGGIWMGP